MHRLALALAASLALPVAGLGALAQPTAASSAQGCTPCECGVAYCEGNTTYWPNVTVEPPDDPPTANTSFPLQVELALEDADGDPAEGNATFNATLTVRYAYGDHVELPDGANRTGTVVDREPVQYPARYRVNATLPAEGNVTLTATAGRGAADPLALQVGSGTEGPLDVAAPAGLATVLAGSLAAAARRR